MMTKKTAILLQCLCLYLSALPLPAQKRPEVIKAEQDAADNAAHDALSNNTNVSYCSSVSQTTQDKFIDSQNYYHTVSGQILDRVNQEHQLLKASGERSDVLEAQINASAGSGYTEDPNVSSGSTAPSTSQEDQDSADAAHTSITSADAAADAGAFAHSGCDYNEATGECPLSGPLYRQYEQLKSTAQEGINAAIQFAKEQSEILRFTENAKLHNSDYELFEALLSDKNSPEGRQSQASNLDIAAKTAAAAKNLSCNPATGHDSKAYHLYRAASAVYLTALVNDTSYHGEGANCRAKEDLAQGGLHNEQVNTLERVTNLQEALFANICLRTTPREVPLQKKCEEHIKKIFVNNPDFLNMPLTRDNALIIFKAAHKAAITELKNKWLKIKIAHEQIKKGKERVQYYKDWIVKVTALIILAEIYAANFKSQGDACAASFSGCAPTPFWDLATFWKGRYILYMATLATLERQVRRWKKFVKEWEKKLAEAKVYTHLACNENDAKSETSLVKAQAEQAKKDLREHIEREKNKFLRRIHDTLRNSSPQKTSLLNILFPPAYAAPTTPVATRKALGIGRGTYAFGQFIVNRNREWFLLSQDVNSHLTWPTDDKDLYPLAFLDENQAENYNDIDAHIDTLKGMMYEPLLKSLDGKKDYDNQAMESLGFPLPETRVLTTARMIKMIEENLKDTKDVLKTAAEQLDKYQGLLTKTKERLPLGQQGLVAAPLKIEKKVHCATGEGTSFRFDSTCSCRKTNTCTSFNFPKFGQLGKPNEFNLVEGLGNDILSGKLESANVKGSKLKKMSSIYKDTPVSGKKSPQARVSSLTKQGKGLGKGRGKGSSPSSPLPARTYPSSAVVNKNRDSGGGGSSGQSSNNALSLNAPGSTKGKTAASSLRNGGNSSATSMLDQNAANNSSSSGIKLPPLSSIRAFRNDNLNDSSYTTNNNTNNNNNKRHLANKDKSDNITASQPLHGKDPSIFKIITRRYIKSAYPVLLKKNH